MVLGHQTSKKGLEVDKAKIEVIKDLPIPTTIHGVRNFLGHTNFARISKLLNQLLQKKGTFLKCIEAFEVIKKKLIFAPIIIIPDWSEPFAIMCDASDYVVGAVMG
ncbi:Retrovirus-related Pol polyprotein from transposon opus [Gossypium australe]|uniref:Retrovirus-related Pol polyprotein from transposon opus n=1 Tax=Gossypium australe TaxID=47621 RepID=A0A5B6X1H4_9ROSI|nr:Retrovirus-related Pol polyprotein from transposon opus [Gossypium australe]